ncbi:MAG: hypothetical protein JW735_11900 [Prolixibacteraceae bacterium]|nr:hypothetical protein [Prolixibacteraceae bacterium]
MQKNNAAPVTNAVKPKVVMKRRASEISTPSILKAMQAQPNETPVSSNEPTKIPVKEQINTKPVDQPFTLEQLHDVWPQMIEKYAEQTHLYISLQNLPVLDPNYLVVITVENSVQHFKISQMKHELVGYLQRTLNNSQIDVRVDVNRVESENKILTDEQKLKEMVQKNPVLQMFRSKFNLDFNG